MSVTPVGTSLVREEGFEQDADLFTTCAARRNRGQ